MKKLNMLLASTGVDSAEEAIRRFKSGEQIFDSEFDRIYPEKVRNLSATFWTPIDVAIRAASFAVREPGDKVLDLGSGAGKFCFAGALSTEGIFVGVEQRQWLVEISSDLVNRFEIPRVSFIHANMMDIDWNSYKSIYLFNPFSENLGDFFELVSERVANTYRIDRICKLSSELYVKYVRYTQKQLHHMPRGTRVVTLNGFGGDFPPDYKCVYSEENCGSPLSVWDKR